MKRFIHSFVLSVVLASLCGCAAMEESYRETYCNYDGSFRRGYNDARYYRPMDVYESESCFPEQKAAADRGYSDGYRSAIAARSGVVIVPAQPAPVIVAPAGTPPPPGAGYPPPGTPPPPPPGYAPPPSGAGYPPPPPTGTPPPPPSGASSAYPPPPPGQGAHSIPVQASCTVNADCPINTFCKNRGDGQSMCLGDGVPGQYCTSSEDCQHGLTCRPVEGALSTCQ